MSARINMCTHSLKGVSNMANSVLVQEKTGIGSQPAARQPQSPDVANIAERILGKALELCAEELSLGSLDAAIASLRQNDVVVHAYYCDVIARLVAESIGAADRNVKAVYAFGDDNADQDLPLVCLLVWISDKTPTFSLSVAALDRALVQNYNKAIRTPERVSLLDVHTIQDADMEGLFGSGRSKQMPLRLAAYMLAQNEVVDIVYVRDAVSG
jgi:hypothetical protein